MAKEKAPLPAAAPADDKKRAIDTAMAQIEKMYGKGSIMRFGDRTSLDVDYIPTGSLALDVALGIGGLPKGRIIEIYGPESSGKTTLALHVVAEAQKRGGEVAFVDAEHALDPTYARALGVKVEDMLSRIPVNRPWRSPKHWCVPEPSMSSWWTPWLPWCPGQKLKAKWATAMWACRPA